MRMMRMIKPGEEEEEEEDEHRARGDDDDDGGTGLGRGRIKHRKHQSYAEDLAHLAPRLFLHHNAQLALLFFPATTP